MQKVTSITLAAGLTLLLAGCRSVPDVTQVPVPTGATVFNGVYSGTATERLSVRDATLSADGQALYVLARASQHSVILELDPVTGQERRRASVALDSPRTLAARADGRLIVMGLSSGGVVDQGTLTLLGTLPQASQVSQDGETLLNDRGQQAIRISTRTGQELSRVALPDKLWNSQTSRDLTWVADSSGDRVVNTLTGEVLDTSAGHLDPCGWRKTDPNGLPLTDVQSVPGGLALAFKDGSVEWRGLDGRLTSAWALAGSCTNSVNQLQLYVSGAQVHYLFTSSGNQNSLQFGMADTGGFQPSYRADLPSNVYVSGFHGAFAVAGQNRPLLAQYAAPTLEVPSVWKQTYAQAQFPVSANVTATYRDQSVYDLAGTWQGPTGTLNLVGTGTNSGGKNPGIIFTQSVCADIDPLFGPACPKTAWSADLLDTAGKQGALTGFSLDPNQAGKIKQTQTGHLDLTLDGEQRSFQFELKPQ